MKKKIQQNRVMIDLLLLKGEALRLCKHFAEAEEIYNQVLALQENNTPATIVSINQTNFPFKLLSLLQPGSCKNCFRSETIREIREIVYLSTLTRAHE
jgi:hypothetical protein